MIRTQVYLTALEQQQLTVLAEQNGIPKSEMIREAIDAFLQAKFAEKQDKMKAIRAAAGMWAERDDLPDFTAIREEMDR
ncbi:MAG TPA: CopG family transcriptional regulator [Gammaproteobacteria bacterium]|nr:CopG family transcriptional regulator [Gammaproteobacteria bacterium]